MKICRSKCINLSTITRNKRLFVGYNSCVVSEDFNVLCHYKGCNNKNIGTNKKCSDCIFVKKVSHKLQVKHQFITKYENTWINDLGMFFQRNIFGTEMIKH